MVIKVGINGFGRIGRVLFRTCLQNPELELAAINDPAIDAEYICYLIKFDSTHGKYNGNVVRSGDEITIDDHHVVKVFHEKLPPSVPWGAAGVQYVIEASGMFTTLEKASGHLQSVGVKRVLVAAPSVDLPMVVLGVNDFKITTDQKVLSCASSTLYCLAPIVKVLEDYYGVAEGFVTSIHAMTPSLKPLDSLCLRGKHWRDHRSIHQNIIPATTGACKALGKIIPQVKDKLSGLAFRVPIVNVSVLDLTIRLNTNTTLQDIVTKIDKASKTHLKHVIRISNDAAVSSDFIGDSHSCIYDQDSSLQLNPNFFKLVCWYENEYSYACRLIDTIHFSERQFRLTDLPSKLVHVRPNPLKKQDVILQTDRCSKDVSKISSCLSEKNPKLFCNLTQEIGLKIKPSPRPVILKKPLSSHNSGAASSSITGRDSRKRHEIFKIWNDNEKVKPPVRQNKESFFHSCISFARQCTEPTKCLNAQERLENVKREFSKMVNITEDLLKKSNNKSMQITTVANTSKYLYMENGDKDGKEISTQVFNKNDNQTEKIQKSNPKIEVCGDYKSSIGVIDSNILNGASNEVIESYNSHDKGLSDYSTGEIETDNSNQNDQLSLYHTENIPVANNSIGYNADENCNLSIDSNILNDKSAFKDHVAKTITTLIDGLSQTIEAHCSVTSKTKILQPTSDIIKKYILFNEIPENKDKTSSESLDTEIYKKHVSENKTSILGSEILANYLMVTNDNPNETNTKTDNKSLQNKEKLNIALIHDGKSDTNPENKYSNTLINSEDTTEAQLPDIYNATLSIENEILTVETDNCRDNIELTKQILEGLNKFAPEPIVIVPKDSGCPSPENTNTSVSNGDVAKMYRDNSIHDKLDSASSTDSENSFEIHGRKSQVIHITDLTNSLDDLVRLDKICRIIEISDELSDKLFSALDNPACEDFKKQKWSFKDLCERINLDEFCNKLFGKTV